MSAHSAFMNSAVVMLFALDCNQGRVVESGQTIMYSVWFIILHDFRVCICGLHQQYTRIEQIAAFINFLPENKRRAIFICFNRSLHMLATCARFIETVPRCF